MDQENKELKILKAQLNAILQSSYDGMYITDGEGMFLNVNNGLERITGVKKEELIGLMPEIYLKKALSAALLFRWFWKKSITIKQTIIGDKL